MGVEKSAIAAVSTGGSEKRMEEKALASNEFDAKSADGAGEDLTVGKNCQFHMIALRSVEGVTK